MQAPISISKDRLNERRQTTSSLAARSDRGFACRIDDPSHGKPNDRLMLFQSPIHNALQSVGTLPPRRRGMAALGDAFTLRLFPMASVEGARRSETRTIDTVETSYVHGDLVRLRAWDVK